MGRFIGIAVVSACAGIMALALSACSQKVLTNIESFQNLPPTGDGRTIAIGDNPEEFAGKFITIWHKVGDHWEATDDIWNLNK